MSVFGCKLDDGDLVRGCAPEQPDEVAVGQRWTNVSTGNTYPVKGIRGWAIDLGSDYFTIVLDEKLLRRDYVCTDPPENVKEIGSGRS